MRTSLKWATIVLFGLLAACTDPSTSVSSDSSNQRAEERSADLYELISSGAVSLVRASGNGASSGNSIDAVLRNNTGSQIDVDIYMSKPLFLKNSGVGQNMIASMLVGADGSYMQKGSRFVVTLDPNEQFSSSIIAYCADFEKDNPTASESFSVTEPPAHLALVIARINDYVRANPNANVTAAGQVAVWLAQGESLGEIAKRYDFTREDEALAYSFMQ